MLETTLEVFKAASRGDPSLDPAARTRIIAAVQAAAAPVAAPITLTLLRRGEVARRLARSTRAVDLLASQGVLRKVVLPGRKRGAGFRESDVIALMQGPLP